MATVAGGLWGVGLGTFQASQFSADASISLVFMVVIGGVATLAGPVIASIAIIGMPVILGFFIDGLANSIQNLITLLGAVGVLLAISAEPEGLGAGLRRTRGRIIQRLESRYPRGIRRSATVPAPTMPPVPAARGRWSSQTSRCSTAGSWRTIMSASPWTVRRSRA
ncbi:hypothetical protein [Microbacterium elymi]|uniref:hypothetical protein n=1 Tax=Microbacterium elymi TaxID=2909587 RepID=UPI0033903878